MGTLRGLTVMFDWANAGAYYRLNQEGFTLFLVRDLNLVPDFDASEDVWIDDEEWSFIKEKIRNGEKLPVKTVE